MFRCWDLFLFTSWCTFFFHNLLFKTKNYLSFCFCVAFIKEVPQFSLIPDFCIFVFEVVFLVFLLVLLPVLVFFKILLCVLSSGLTSHCSISNDW